MLQDHNPLPKNNSKENWKNFVKVNRFILQRSVCPRNIPTNLWKIPLTYSIISYILFRSRCEALLPLVVWFFILDFEMLCLTVLRAGQEVEEPKEHPVLEVPAGEVRKEASKSCPYTPQWYRGWSNAVWEVLL